MAKVSKIFESVITWRELSDMKYKLDRVEEEMNYFEHHADKEIDDDEEIFEYGDYVRQAAETIDGLAECLKNLTFTLCEKYPDED